MYRLPTLALLVSLAMSVASEPAQEKFLYPKNPLVPSGAAPSPKVTNGTVFESGSLRLPKGHALVLPENAVVEEYDGRTARFFLTKSLRCSGHPPASMKFDKSRGHYGIAQRVEEEAVVVSTFGEWRNKGGSARIRLLVLVPRDLKVDRRDGLHGPKSAASTKMDFGDKVLKRRYWYSGRLPKEGWKEIATSLHFSRFLSPR